MWKSHRETYLVGSRADRDTYCECSYNCLSYTDGITEWSKNRLLMLNILIPILIIMLGNSSAFSFFHHIYKTMTHNY